MNKFYITTITDEQVFIENLKSMTKEDIETMVNNFSVIPIITEQEQLHQAVG
ncbi:hypothetical protein [Clostridium botulinum]|uniref:hypothetical protein n=1 Tax=Clostridium botulinum TaxID=1491 RepID=UPI001E489B87|nr:hypothetical protein [Clostridium botulinum]MCD3254359.1 hypothetical protein [Clostridium botulinum C/D]MCD3279859.1 hypothetical protein [Clostridium botulinum C/D]MCD3339590.1 hypothetical protein [Clostridium botulinum C/D]MCD3357498.1 hypothetical protein [Clostridium botulinum C/D]